MGNVLPALRPRLLALRVLAALFFAACWQPAWGQEAPTAESFEGVWKVTQVVRTGANAKTDAHPQPGLLIFCRGYYSITWDKSTEPRKPSPEPKDPQKPTEAEKIAKYDEWAPFGASAGTYEVRGNVIITHNIVAKQAKGMARTEKVNVKMNGGTFVVSTQDGVTQTTYTRIR